MHPKPGLCQLVMPCGAAAMAQLMCLLLRGTWLITAALGSGGILSAVLAVLQVWGGPRCMQTLLLLWPSLCICNLAARFAALQTVLCAPPLLLLGLHHGSCDSAASAVLESPQSVVHALRSHPALGTGMVSSTLASACWASAAVLADLQAWAGRVPCSQHMLEVHLRVPG